METYSKALNAGQYPLSVLALTEHAAGIYQRGTYGNTMTGIPRALDVACAVLDALTPELRKNIRERGEQALASLGKLKDELGGLITKVQGTGLLFSCELDPGFKGYGPGSSEEWLREQGRGVIHGGEIGRAHVRTPVTNAHIVCRLLLEKKTRTNTADHM